MIALSEQLSWYVSRAAGFTAWALTAFAVLWGLLLSTGILRGRPSRPWLLDLHRYVGGLSVIFVGVHLGALVADNFVYFGWAELFVPMASQWQPGAVAWGIVAFYLLIAVEVTSLLRRRFVSERIWRTVHASSFLLFGFGTVHTFQAGTDMDVPWVFWTVVCVTAAVLALSWWRVLAGRSATRASVRRDTSPQRPATAPLASESQHDLGRSISG